MILNILIEADTTQELSYTLSKKLRPVVFYPKNGFISLRNTRPMEDLVGETGRLQILALEKNRGRSGIEGLREADARNKPESDRGRVQVGGDKEKSQKLEVIGFSLNVGRQ
ncbi:hypothetical protein RRG08_001014 [Elysia crispata]|uniref:Uncharacterized protein n=1 Tax=Elysia crispata TaxID=231223 RepID=A0AAE1E6P9_9GAST|nr:hypothetical protein RRG08_001014 [Elysia crispata]